MPSEHSCHQLLTTHPHATPSTALQLTHQSAHLSNHIPQHLQPTLPRLSAPPPQPQYRPMATTVGITRMGLNRGRQLQHPQFPSHLFCHKSADKDIFLNSTPSPVSIRSSSACPTTTMPSSLTNSLSSHHIKNEEKLDHLNNADQAIRMSNAVDGLLSLRTVHAAAAVAAAAAASISSSPSSQSMSTTNVIKPSLSTLTSTPNIINPPPHLNSLPSSSPEKRRSPINMERLWAGDRSQLPNHGQQSSGDVRIYNISVLPQSVHPSALAEVL